MHGYGNAGKKNKHTVAWNVPQKAEGGKDPRLEEESVSHKSVLEGQKRCQSPVSHDDREPGFYAP